MLVYDISKHSFSFNEVKELLRVFYKNKCGLQWVESDEFVQLNIYLRDKSLYKLLFQRDYENQKLILPSGRLKVSHKEIKDSLEEVFKMYQMVCKVYEEDVVNDTLKMKTYFKQDKVIHLDSELLTEEALQLKIDYKLSELSEALKEEDETRINNLELELQKLAVMMEVYK